MHNSIKPSKQHNNRGFTLIELMIAVVIVAILSSIAVPMYQNYTQRGYRSDAIRTLQNIMAAQERYYTSNVAYTTTLTGTGTGSLGLTLDTTRYTFRAARCDGGAGNNPIQCIQITATPTTNGSQVGDGNLILNSRGEERRVVGTVNYKWSGETTTAISSS